MDDGEGGFLDHLTRMINEQHMCNNIFTQIFFPQLFLPQRPFIGELLFVCFLVQRSLYLLWRGLIRNGPPVCPKHIQPVHKCMQMPLFFCFYFLGGGCFHVLIWFLQAIAHTQMQACEHRKQWENGSRDGWVFITAFAFHMLTVSAPTWAFSLTFPPENITKHYVIKNKSKLCSYSTRNLLSQ